MKGIVYNTSEVGLKLSGVAIDWLQDHGVDTDNYQTSDLTQEGPDMEFRSDPMVVECVKELGYKAGDRYCEPRVLEYDEMKFQPKIDYDTRGNEWREDVSFTPVVDKDKIEALIDDHDVEGLLNYLEDRDIDIRNDDPDEPDDIEKGQHYDDEDIGSDMEQNDFDDDIDTDEWDPYDEDDDWDSID